MVKLRPYVVAVNHVPGCPRLDSGQGSRKQGRRRCAPGCEHVTDGWEVDLALRLPDGTRIRERVKAPVAAKSAALRWAQEREAYLLAERGGKGERTSENEKATETSITLEAYAKDWLEDRRARDVGAYFDERSRFRNHIVPALGQLRLGEIRPHHVRDFLRELRTKPSVRGGTLAPRSIRHVYATLRQALHDAVVDELIPANPVQVKKSDLPAKADKDPRWRKTAVFAREEVELLISPNDEVPDDRRVAYAVEFLTGARPGEVSALRWRDYDRSAEPLGRLSVATAYSTRLRREKATKTERPREIPVHPTLASVLGEWRLEGWARSFGHRPGLDDLIVPAREGGMRDVGWALRCFHRDLEKLGLRRRRHYDSRRTFISLALGGGARKDLLRWITHAPGDVFDGYTSPPWASLCEQVTCLRVGLNEGRVSRSPRPPLETYWRRARPRRESRVLPASKWR
jgi:integrase